VSNGATLGLRMTTAAAGAFTEQQFLDLHAGTLSGVTMGATAYAGFENTGTITLSASLTGTRGLTKLGGGNLTLTGQNTYTGGTFINQGNLQIGDGGTSGAIVGNVVMASAADSFRQLIFNRSDDMTYGGDISGSGSLRKEGAGTLTLTGDNTYVNATTLAQGTLVVAGQQAVGTAGTGVAVSDNAKFELAESGLLTLFVRNTNAFSRLQAASDATTTPQVLINGRFAFDLSTAPTNVGTTWQIVSANLATVYGAGFLVQGFNGVNGGNWTNTTNGVAYVFSQADGTLTVQESGPTNAYDAWAAYWQQQDPSFTETAPGADPDGDSFNNDTEFAFGGNPTVGTPALLQAVRSGGQVSMSFIARRDALESYHVLSTTNLATVAWTTNSTLSVADAPDQSGVLLPADYVRRAFQVTPAGNEFFRVSYEP
jgi:autotransporter-associated beta strand protein